MQNDIGFPEFRQAALQQLEPMWAAVKPLIQVGREMLMASAPGHLQDLAKQITQSVANSMESVLLLVPNGCGVDSLKIARSMFEAAVTIHYLDSHPELAQDFVDYLWVIRKKHHDYRLTLPPAKVQAISLGKIAEMESNYKRVRVRWKVPTVPWEDPLARKTESPFRNVSS